VGVEPTACRFLWPIWWLIPAQFAPTSTTRAKVISLIFRGWIDGKELSTPRVLAPSSSDARSIIRSRIRTCNEPFLRANSSRGLAASPRRERQGGRVRKGALSRPADPKTRFATGGFRFRRERDSWAGAEPRNQIPVGANGTVWQKGNAVPGRGPLRGKRSRREGDSIRQASGAPVDGGTSREQNRQVYSVEGTDAV
jgi:hypothetical protein